MGGGGQFLSQMVESINLSFPNVTAPLLTTNPLEMILNRNRVSDALGATAVGMNNSYN